MPMPRVVSGTAPSASVLNTIAQEVDNLGTGCRVVRTSAQAGITTSTDLLVNWQAAAYDTFASTGSPMWTLGTPNLVTIRVDGVYLVTLQERWSPTGGNGTGQRAGKILLNGSSVFANSIASGKVPADATNEGATVSIRAVWPLHTGDFVFANYWCSAGATISGLHTDYGGSSLSVARLGPLS